MNDRENFKVYNDKSVNALLDGLTMGKRKSKKKKNSKSKSKPYLESPENSKSYIRVWVSFNELSDRWLVNVEANHEPGRGLFAFCEHSGASEIKRLVLERLSDIEPSELINLHCDHDVRERIKTTYFPDISDDNYGVGVAYMAGGRLVIDKRPQTIQKAKKGQLDNLIRY